MAFNPSSLPAPPDAANLQGQLKDNVDLMTLIELYEKIWDKWKNLRNAYNYQALKGVTTTAKINILPDLADAAGAFNDARKALERIIAQEGIRVLLDRSGMAIPTDMLLTNLNKSNNAVSLNTVFIENIKLLQNKPGMQLDPKSRAWINSDVLPYLAEYAAWGLALFDRADKDELGKHEAAKALNDFLKDHTTIDSNNFTQAKMNAKLLVAEARANQPTP